MRRPLYSSLHEGRKWRWRHHHEMASCKVKTELTGGTTFSGYSPGKPLVVDSKASLYGIGEVLYPRCEDGMQPLGCRSLTLTETNIAPI